MPLLLNIDADSGAALYKQVYDALRSRILDGQLSAGAKLPSSRELAESLSISRQTVTIAYEQLLAEGYIEGKRGSGTYVASTIPEALLRTGGGKGAKAAPPSARLSIRGEALGLWPKPDRIDPHELAFRAGTPALDAFPYELWRRLSSQYWTGRPDRVAGYLDPGGFPPLRRAIAAYLTESRGVRCEPEQIIVTSGSQQSLALAAHVLLDAGGQVAVEDPGYKLASAAFAAAGLRIEPVRVDDDGLDPADLRSGTGMVYVTPSHQYPLGCTLTLTRRLELIEWASRHRAWILEDDYDSEYRYSGRPLTAMQGLDSHGCVVYLGTFSKVLLPALRLGYLVAPPDVVDAFTAAKAVADRHSPTPEQAVVARFIDEGHFARHLRRMRVLYAERQRLLLDAIAKEAGDLLEVPGSPAGMHLVARMLTHQSESDVVRAAAERGLYVRGLSAFRVSRRLPPALVLGYAGVREQEIRPAVRKLVQAMRAPAP